MARHRIAALAGAPGTGEGIAYLHAGPADNAARQVSTTLPPERRDDEIARFHAALARAAAELEALQARIGAEVGSDEAAIFEAQALFLQDPSLIEPSEAAIRADGLPARIALHEATEAAARDLEALEDPYLRARAADLRDVRHRVARLLGTAVVDLQTLPPGSILVARDLAPSETATLPLDRVRGIVLAGGAPTAHAAILARGRGLPLVLGAGDALWAAVAPGDRLLVDGTAGLVLVDPDDADRAAHATQLADPVASPSRPPLSPHMVREPARTRDGRRIALFANASSAAEAHAAHGHGAEGIGLLRTEFLLAALQSGRDGPDEDALADAYGAVLAPMGGMPVVVRALDAGGDKPLPFLDFGIEANPFLGWRGIRVLLDRPDLFASQTRALLRAASRHGTDLRLLFPMVSGVDEVRRARSLVADLLRDTRHDLAFPLRIGVMIEVPAAALLADVLAREADFFSLGTNDLAQYALAADRGNARVSPLCRFSHPAVLRLVDMAVRAAHAAGRPVGVCGEAAGDVPSAALLVGLGVDELSMAPPLLPTIRAWLRGADHARLQRLARRALAASTAGEVDSLWSASILEGAG